MPVYKPSELRQFLRGLGIGPKKTLSQNFLIDGNIIRKIVAASNVQPDDVVLEIGSGPGSLTEALLNAQAKVIAVERDEILAKALQRFSATGTALQVYCEDIMQFPIEERLQDALTAGKKAKVIANLPYHLTTPIIAQLITMRSLFSSLTLMVQEEVARRFTALPGTSSYSSFTVFLNFYSRPEYAFTVSRHCFFPKPSVESAVVLLPLIESPLVSDKDNFFMLTRTAFEHRRKMLRSSLRELYSPSAVEEALTSLHLNPMARPEELSVSQFISLFERLTNRKDL